MPVRSKLTLAVTALALFATTALAACGDDSGSGSSSGQVRLAVTDLQGLEELQREFGSFVEVLEQESGLDIEFFAVNDRVAATVALEADRVDVVFTGPAEYVVMKERTDVVPVVAIRRPDYHSCVYTTVDSGFTSLADLEGETVGMTDVGSTSGHLGPSQLFVDAGIDPLEDVEVLTVGDAVHEALARGDVAAAGVGCHDYAEYMESEDPADFPVIAEGPPLPPDVIVARPGFDEETIATLRATFEDNFPALLTAMLEGKDNAKYDGAELVIVEDGDYDTIRDMYRAIGVDDFTEFVGD